MSDLPEEVFDPAATDETTDNARNGAAKRIDPNEPCAVVGLGASAGGVTVLQQFFGEMPAESGLAFVVVMHLSREHESHLADIIQQKTSMPVTQVTQAVKVRANHVYVIPPNKQLTFVDSTLELVQPQEAPGRRVTIDLFFRTLAQAYGQRAVGVILSGTDTDGVIGLKHVRAQGGVTIAQDPEEAEHDSMPLSAINTGMVDWVLPVSGLAPKLMEFVRNESRMQLPPEIPDTTEANAKVQDAPGGETVARETRESEDESALGEVLRHLRAQTGHDFTHYKRATVLRRIARRLQVNSRETIPQYLEFLRQHPAEADALLQDLLIGVTHFFRDQASFAALETNIPQLFAGKRQEDQIRIWVAGCATGEEAYSIAIMFCEYAERLDSPPSFQIFASDIDDQSIADARDGTYPQTIEADISMERLRRFFVKDYGRYRVRKELREKILFASHDLLKDAPFSRIDLISCRNLLIYLTPKAQERIFDIFHFALRASGLLFIGGSEASGSVLPLFSPVDAKHRLYVRRSIPRANWAVPLLPLRSPVPLAQPAVVKRRPRKLPALGSSQTQATQVETATSLHGAQERRAVLFGQLHLQLLEQYGPPSVVVNDRHDIVHLSQNAGRYLKFSAGEPSANLMAVVLPQLRVELCTALFRAAQTRDRVHSTPQTLEVDGGIELVSLIVQPMGEQEGARGYFLVLFEKQADATSKTAVDPGEHGHVARHLEDEIQSLNGQLNSTVEQYEATNEELQASNEELQAMNEEMRSAAEELETSKEELQSANEELLTVNHELKSSVEELGRSNTDLNNLMASTDIGTIFLDRQLCIQRFTPSAQRIFNLIPADMGRPLSDITHKLAYAGLIADAEQVLRDLAMIEREVNVGGTHWYLTRIAPYRTAEDRIAGVVATFIDITRRRQAEEERQKSTAALVRQTRIFDMTLSSIADFAYIFDKEGRFVFANQSLADLLQMKPEAMVGKNFFDLDYPADLAGRLQRQIEHVFATKEVVRDETPFTSPAGTTGFYEYIFQPLLGADGAVESVVGSTRDVTERQKAEQALCESEERFRQFAENSADVFWIVDAKTRRVEYLNPVFETMWGDLRAHIVSDFSRLLHLVHPDDREIAGSLMPRLLAGETETVQYRILRANDGEVRWMRGTGFPIRDEAGAIFRVAGVIQDVTDDHYRSAALRESEERYRLLVEGARDYAIFLIDTSNTIVHWNSGAERIFGWSAEEAIGQSGELIFTPEDRAREQEEHEISVALEKGMAPDIRWHMRKDGSRIWVDGVMRRLDDEKTGALRGFAKIARDATDQKATEEALREAHDDLEERVRQRTGELQATNETLEAEMQRRQSLEREILQVTERERARISQDLHDSLCQELTATAFLLKSRAKSLRREDPEAAESLEEAAETVNNNAGLARDLARGMHPFELGSGGLSSALRELCSRTQEKVDCRTVCPRRLRVADNIAVNLYRIAQEAVTNATKHSKCRSVVVQVKREGKDLVLSVSDDGKPKAGRSKKTGMGIHMMEYRASAMSGTLQIQSSADKGTTVTCRVPLKK